MKIKILAGMASCLLFCIPTISFSQSTTTQIHTTTVTTRFIEPSRFELGFMFGNMRSSRALDMEAQRQLATHMIAPLVLLDQMWHEFILHTQDYTQFCEAFFNQYLHHKVESVGEEYVLSTEELSAFLSDSYDCLGEEWVLRNFSTVLAEPAS